ncbi:branched-chain amino acid transport system permease protein [Lipingzhangella halophila]|uniref:Branched-chain amino acid transport system permease protein n=1 Tax=Lipingzhangella halophila TaxID=1783352 RepID=A0A7W7RFP8_9ACTN|nr:branched-chain amino acid ABC transporter permease [Lipingzhangella halophila]MBB4931040.1 branched-chain amino acid transport system permease protein [Lipingzhangella halophila]
MSRRLVTVLLAVIAAILVIPGYAAADDQGGETLSGQISDPGSSDGGVEGIDITVTDDAGDEIGTATTDTEGAWEVDLPEPGTYTVVLDEDTIPDDLEGYEIAPGAEQEKSVREGQDQVTLFRFIEPEEPAGDSEDSDQDEDELAEEEEAAEEGAEAPDVDESAPFSHQVAQVATNGLVYGLVIAIASVGLSLIFGTTRMINFAHGDMVTFGALMAMLFSTGAGGLGNSILGLLVAVALAIGIGLVLRNRVPPGVRLAVQSGLLVLGIVGATLVGIFGGEATEWRVSLLGNPGLGSQALDIAAIVLVPVAVAAAALAAGRLLRGRVSPDLVLPLQGVVLLVGLAAGVWLGAVGAALIAVVLGAALAAGMERYIWQPLRLRNVVMIQLFIVSIGVALLLRHVLLVLFGGSRMSYPEYQVQDMVGLGPIALAPRSLGIMAIAVLVLVAVACMLQFTRVGKAMRAVSDNRDLAESSGIDVARITLYVWTLGGGLSALGGILAGVHQIVHWQMGFHLLLLMFAAVILGGLGTAYGAMVGGIAIGMVAMMSTLWFPHQLMQAWALAIMIIMLLVRPQGLLGRRERIG